METGELNLTTLSKAQTAIRAREKSKGTRMDDATKKSIVQKIQNKSVQDAEQILSTLIPEFKSSVSQDRKPSWTRTPRDTP